MAAAIYLKIHALQSIITNNESNLPFDFFMCPLDASIEHITSIGSFNFIIIGAGTAGSVLANRLSSCPSVSVLVLEAGGCPPMESFLFGLFPILPQTKYDYDMHSVNDNYALQNLQGGVAGVTAGKMLGGSSSIHHGLHVRGGPPDFMPWAKAANDSSWSYDGLLPYFIKSENTVDKDIVEDYSEYHGTSGPTELRAQRTEKNIDILESFSEMGYSIRIDTNNDNANGVIEPQVGVGKLYRQSGVVSYLNPVKTRPNLHIMTGATATKIIFNDEKVATAVQFSYKGRSYIVKCIDEIIVSAGAIKTPQLLMLSGIGPSDHLKSKNIPVISDLPVGKNLHDHVAAPILIKLERNILPIPFINPIAFPYPVVCNFINLDNSSANFAQYQGIDAQFPPYSIGLMVLCLNVFKYKVSMCQLWHEANLGRNIWVSVATLLHPQSRGYLLLNTTDINDQPLIHIEYLSNKTDVTNLAKFLEHMIKILDTTYFKKIGAEFVDLGVCTEHKKFSFEYWECYAVAMSSTLWHYCGTAAIGSVVDNKLLVKGVTGLRLVDASVIPVIPGGDTSAAVLAIAEKIADVIRSTYKYNCS